MAFEEELNVARELSRHAGSLVRAVYQDQTRFAISFKDGHEPLTRADRESNDFIVSQLQQRYPHDAVLAEESVDDSSRLANTRVWIVDPLDGTKEFIAQNGEFAVMIGLAVECRSIVGAVYLPARDLLYYAAEGSGCWCEEGNDRPPRRLQSSAVSFPSQARIVMSRSHLKDSEKELIDKLQPAERIISGSVGVKLSLIAEQKADIYLSTTTQGIKEWDTCAPEIILREAGGTVTSIDGQPLRYNKPAVQQGGGILACASQSLLREVLTIFNAR